MSRSVLPVGQIAPLALLVLAAASCRALPEPMPPGASGSELLERAPDPPAEPDAPWRPAPEPGVDWARLGSGEWLRGELLHFDGDTLAFESDVLGELAIDWEDVEEVLTDRPFTVLLEDRSVVFGTLGIGPERVRIEGPSGVWAAQRDELVRVVPGLPREGNYWSARLRVSATARSGNTDQTDTSFWISATRETAATRLELSQDSVVGTLEGEENVNNHTFRGRYDVRVTSRFYVTPLGLELFRDRFQNVDLRAAPYSGAGYALMDRPSLSWDVDAGLGYRWTRFDSVAAGADDTDGTATLVVGTKLEKDLTSHVDLGLEYRAQIGLEDTTETNQDASVLVSMDFLWGLDFDVRAVWKRVGDPEPDADGVTPERDDFRLELGLSWES